MNAIVLIAALTRLLRLIAHDAEYLKRAGMVDLGSEGAKSSFRSRGKKGSS